MPVWTNGIQEKLATLRDADPALRVFGASSHQYKMKPPVSASELEAFESRVDARMPDEYRDFLLHVGNGGAGPAHCVFPLGFHANGHTWVAWEPGRDVGTIAKPFALAQPWNLSGFWSDEDDDTAPSDATTSAAARELERLGVDIHRELIGQSRKNPFTGKTFKATLPLLVMEGYYSRELLDGAIPLNTDGCNLSCWLVVTGVERGHVWRDLRADHGGIVPAQAPDRDRLTFRQWYEGWLEESLVKARGKRLG